MTDQPVPNGTTPDPELTMVVTTGDCGHLFPVALGRISDGADFSCPVCGALDRFEAADVAELKEEIARQEAGGSLDPVAELVRDYLSGTVRET